ncbi:hypothetical protein ABFS82_01G064000 [Erythranthe guttata]|nr:PREDICTED: probable WRKY transcription factor 53 isoform X2 [Erythranthe guttata]|eukprot:XP_012854266.1 PREDICTED: probable WRKY transcription factor 53 isoform X2 [Erythranthe guttata]
MDSALPWDYKMLIEELTQGMENATQLRLRLCATSPSKDHDFLVQTILSTFEKALLALRWRESIGQPQVGPPTPTAPDSSSVSVDTSPKSEDTKRNFGDNKSKKRKLQPTWTEKVRVDYENGLDGPKEDGHNWRKYGQKDILGHKYPRSYYRCTYRTARNCWATKQVQRSDKDPTLFEIVYKGVHACNASHCHHQTEQKNNPTLSEFKANLRVETEDLGGIEEVAAAPHFSFPSAFYDNDLGEYEYSPLFYSPATSASNYFSSHASTTNSPIGGTEFSIVPQDLDQNFPFSSLGFFV